MRDSVKNLLLNLSTIDALVSLCVVNLQEEMAANFNNFLRVQRTRRKRKSKRAKQTC